MNEEKYYYDVVYDAWMLGGNSDNVNRDITDEDFHNDVDSIESAKRF